MRKAAHNTLYMVANSNAMQGIVPGSTVSYKLATWQKCLILGDVIAAVIVIIGITMIIRKKKTEKFIDSVILFLSPGLLNLFIRYYP